MTRIPGDSRSLSCRHLALDPALKSQRPPAVRRLLLVLLATSIAHADAPSPPPAVELDLVYDGQSGTAQAPPDPGGAAAILDVLDMVSGAVTIRDGGTGQLVSTSSADAFWTAAGIPGTPAAFAQHAIFDPESQRWYASAEQATAGAPNQIYVASSLTYDVRSPWKAIALPAQAATITNTHLAVDPAGLYITGDIGGHSILMALPLEDLQWTGTGAPTAAHSNVFSVARAGLVPAIDGWDNVFADSRMFVARDVAANGDTAIALYRLSWQGSVLGTQTRATLAAPEVVDLGAAYAVPSAPAQQPSPGPALDAGNGELANASASGGSIVGIATTEQAGRLAAMWFVISADPSTPGIASSVVQEGVIGDPAADLIVPAIAFGTDNSIGVVVVRTSAVEPPAVYVTGQGYGDETGAMRPLVLARAGSAPYSCAPVGGVSSFGRYSSLAGTATGFWAVAQYGASSADCGYATTWVNFDVPSMIPPGGGGGDDFFGDDAGSHGDPVQSTKVGCAGCSSSGTGGAALPCLFVAVGLCARRRRRG
jgi:hypothetical protein